MRTVAIKTNAGTMSVMYSLQNPAVDPGWNSTKSTLTVHILNVPDDVEELDALELYSETVVWHTRNSPYTVDFSALGEGKKVVVKALDSADIFAGLKEAADILGWKKQQVTEYIRRGKFPLPVQVLASGPVWERAQIEDYRDSRQRD
ncbi:hypothetical protein ABU162_04345 [Paenibacillus thiaminolyticus]|uniref:helix-turn-helix transcriptional regulator n=1 Tax=Paenibacillus thiaminolyticus TaxID=49283 RepID=UPI0035A69965